MAFTVGKMIHDENVCFVWPTQPSLSSLQNFLTTSNTYKKIRNGWVSVKV